MFLSLICHKDESGLARLPAAEKCGKLFSNVSWCRTSLFGKEYFFFREKSPVTVLEARTFTITEGWDLDPRR
jgi:hypothetical protein